VYTGGRDWLGSRGSVIRYNYIHDSLGYGFKDGRWVSPHYAWGIYLDDNAGGVDVIGNVVARAIRGLIHLHNGRDNRVENNVFIGGALQQIECSGWTATTSDWTEFLPTMIKAYESVAEQPAWRAMRNMHIHPSKAVLSDGKIMTGNVFLRNIVMGTDPQTKYVSVHQFPFEHNAWDYNLVWNGGRPVRTGQLKAGRDLSDTNLAPNGSFEDGRPGVMPTDWHWLIRPVPTATAELVAEDRSGGRLALRMDAALVAEQPRDNHPTVTSKGFELPLGRHFRLSAHMKATQPNLKASLMLQSYVANAYFWASTPNEITVGTEWKNCEFVFKTPAPGEKGWHEQMRTFNVRVGFRGAQGSLFVDDITLKEIEMLDEWSAWQAMEWTVTRT